MSLIQKDQYSRWFEGETDDDEVADDYPSDVEEGFDLWALPGTIELGHVQTTSAAVLEGHARTGRLLSFPNWLQVGGLAVKCSTCIHFLQHRVPYLRNVRTDSGVLKRRIVRSLSSWYYLN